MKTIIKLPFKIAALPFVPAFFLLSLAMKFFAWASGRIFALLSLLFAVGGMIALFKGDIGLIHNIAFFAEERIKVLGLKSHRIMCQSLDI